MTGISLPPQPDDTGEPRPPRAPRVAGPWNGCHPRGRRAVSTPPRPQKIYAVGEPILEAAIAKRLHPLRHAARVPSIGALVYGPLLLAYVVFVAPTDGSASTLDDAVVATVIVAGLLGLVLVSQYLRTRRQGVIAGARWVGDSGNDLYYLMTYELAGITIVDTKTGPELRLTGHIRTIRTTLQFPCGLLEGNQRLWDLVYNGLLHSAAADAEVDPRTRQLLRLPAPSANSST